jgi:hypothetical protein
MEGKEVSSGGTSSCCEPHDLVSQKSGIFLWYLPIAAVILGSSWPSMRAWLWIPAFLIMGIGCLVNARRCGRLHCYITGPAFVLAAIYVALAAASIVPMRSNPFLPHPG